MGAGEGVKRFLPIKGPEVEHHPKIADASDLRIARDAAAFGVDGLKLYADLAPEVVEALAADASGDPRVRARLYEWWLVLDDLARLEARGELDPLLGL